MANLLFLFLFFYFLFLEENPPDSPCNEEDQFRERKLAWKVLWRERKAGTDIGKLPNNYVICLPRSKVRDSDPGVQESSGNFHPKQASVQVT